MKIKWLAAVLDVAVFLSFAVFGQRTHGVESTIGTLAVIVLPFLIGWFGAAIAVRLYERPLSFGRCASTYLMGMTAGFLIRVFAFGRGVPVTFVIVVGLFVAAFVFGWRLIAIVVRHFQMRRPTVT